MIIDIAILLLLSWIFFFLVVKLHILILNCYFPFKKNFQACLDDHKYCHSIIIIMLDFLLLLNCIFDSQLLTFVPKSFLYY